jgi:hypothetical protein
VPIAHSIFAAGKKPAFSRATTVRLSGATSGTTAIEVTYTVSLDYPTVSGTVVVTPAASNGGVCLPASLTFSAATYGSQSFTVTRSTDGTSSVSVSNNAGLSNDTPISLTTTTPSSGDDGWSTRIAGPSVVWYHSFDTAAEVNRFRWSSGYGSGNDPLGLGSDAAKCAWVATGGADGGGFMRLNYPQGANSAGSYWIRPFAPFTGTGNGRGVADPGASGTITAQAWNPTDGGGQTRGYTSQASSPAMYGHATDQAANPTKYHGNDYYLMVRERRTGTPGLAPDAPPFANIVGKSIWLNITTDTSTANELVTFGQSPADVIGVHERHRMYEGANRSGDNVGIGGSNQTVTISNSDGVNDWRYSGGWDTLLYHVTPGTHGGTGSNRTRLEVWAQHDLTLFPGESGQFVKIWDMLYTAFYDQGTNSAGDPCFNGWNDVILAIYQNGATFSQSFSYDYDQVIFSKATIPAPTTPAAFPGWVTAAVGEWQQIPNSAMSSLTFSPAPPGSPNNRVDAWTSFVVDPRTSEIISAANGGHADYGGNEVVKLVLETGSPGWTTLRGPTANAQITSNTPSYADGRPSSRHSYYGATFESFTGTGRVYVWGGGIYAAPGDPGGVYPNSAAFNLNTGDWSSAATIPNLPSAVVSTGGAFACCADPTTGDVYFWGGRTIARFNRASGTMTTLLSDTGRWGYVIASAYDTTRNRFFLVGTGGGETSNHTYTAAGGLVVRTLTGSAASAVLAAGQAGMVYVQAIDAYLLRTAAAGGTVYRIDANTFDCTTLATTGGSAVQAAVNGNGPYNKFLYCPRLRGVVYVAVHGSNAWYLRVH